MAKRFFDTRLPKKKWFRDAPLHIQASYLFILAECDHSGVWDIDLEIISVCAKHKITLEDLLKYFNEGKERIRIIDETKIYLTGFVEFQYGELKMESKVHLSVMKSLTSHGIEFVVKPKEPKQPLSTSPSAIYSRLSEKRRSEIRAADNNKCTYCGVEDDGANLVVDHIIPRNKGGENFVENLTTACIRCNTKKSDKDVAYFIQEQSLSSTLSENLISKIEYLRNLNNNLMFLNTPKDKEEDKEIAKAMDEEREIEKARLKKEIEDFHKKYPKTAATS